MLSMHGAQLFILLIILQNEYAIHAESDGIFTKRWGNSLLSEGLPLWLEKREPELWDITDRVIPNEIYGANDSPSQYKIAVENNLQVREDSQLARLLRTLDGESVPYDGRTDTIIDDSLRVPTRSTRSVQPAPASSWLSLRGPVKWQPIVVGVGACVIAICAVIGGAVYYRKNYLPNHRAHGLHGSGDLFAKVSPTGSLLGDTTVISMEGDRKLAHSAQMYHYQHQKQQMLAVERASEPIHPSEGNSESDPEEGDFTMYECPGLTDNNPLEIHNPLYEGNTNEDSGVGYATNGNSGAKIVDSEPEDTSTADTPTAKQPTDTF